MLDMFENWVKANSSDWNKKGIEVDEVGRHPKHYLMQSIWVKQSTQNAFGQIQIWESDNLYLMDFMALNNEGQDFYRHYEFTDTYDFDSWQNEYISFMCGV